MLFAHDTEQALDLVVDLVNTAPEDPSGTEHLPDVAALEDWVRGWRFSGIAAVGEADLEAIHAVRAMFRPVFAAAPGPAGDAAAAEAVNALMSYAPVQPRLTDHDGYDLHVHYFARGASLAAHVAIDGGIALAQVLSAGERERLRLCAAPDCRNVLVDLSRNRSKRYCDARTCGNRLHVAAYRERQRAVGG